MLCRSSYTIMELTFHIIKNMFTDVLLGTWRLVPARVGSTPGWAYYRTSGHTSPIWVGNLDASVVVPADHRGKGSVPGGAHAGDPV